MHCALTQYNLHNFVALHLTGGTIDIVLLLVVFKHIGVANSQYGPVLFALFQSVILCGILNLYW